MAYIRGRVVTLICSYSPAPDQPYTKVGKLPDGMAPPSYIVHAAYSKDTYAAPYVEVTTNGEVAVSPQGSASTIYDCLTFVTA